MKSSRKTLSAKCKDLSWIINVSLASAKIQKLQFEEPQKLFNARPTLHIILRAPIGSIKSTILEQIAKDTQKYVMPEISKPGLVGTIDTKTYQLIPGAAWECRNSLMLIDEFNWKKKDNTQECFLQLLEQQKWSRRFGVFSSSQTERDNDLYLNVDKGMINMKTRFACIIGTMKNFSFMRGQGFRALLTRTTPYNFTLTEDELELIAEGHELYRPQEIKTEQNITVKKARYMQIKKTVCKELKRQASKPTTRRELMLRAIGDCARIYAITGKNDRKIFSKLIAWKVQAHEQVGSYYKKQ